MASLKSWMRAELLSDEAMAERIGGVSARQVRAMRFGERGPSARVCARIFEITGGAVSPADLVPTHPRSASVPSEAAA